MSMQLMSLFIYVKNETSVKVVAM